MKPLKRLERYLSAFFTFGRTKAQAKEAYRALERTAALEEARNHHGARLDRMGQDLGAMQASLDARADHLGDIDARVAGMRDWQQRHEALAEDLVADYLREREMLRRVTQSDTRLLARMFTDISRRLDGGAGGPASRPETKAALPDTEGFALFKDSFYHRLENRWRGDPAEIARRLRVYLPDIEAARARTGDRPVMDLGCGRGEWLGLLKDHGIPGFGIDTNTVQIEDARQAGLDVREGDALQALADQPDASLSALTAHHLIEHLPFDAVAWIVREAGRVLAPGGLLLFETPDTRNVLVGATTFYTDPTHLKPMPEQVMGVLLETAGFDPIDIRHINPHARLGEFLDKADVNEEIAQLLFGPQDLAILGQRPGDA